MTNNRAVSTTLNYILGLAIAFLLVAGLFITAGSFVGDQRETGVRTEMEVLGEQIAVDIEAADRMAQTIDDGNVTVHRSLPSRLSGTGYTIAVEADPDPYLTLTSTNPDVEVTVGFTNTTDVELTRLKGGSIQVTYDNSENALVLKGSDR